MLYLCPPSGPEVVAAMRDGLIGAMTTPMQGNDLPAGVPYGADNGRFGKGWVGAAKWFDWLGQTAEEYGPELCLWATAPDSPPNPEATLEMSLIWLPKIQDLGVPAAFVAQNGCERGMVPWDSANVLFLGGMPECVPCGFVRPAKAFNVEHCPHCHRRLTEWKTSVAARALVREALDRGLDAHMGRVNGGERLILADSWGCASADGTCVTRGPAKNLRRIKGWLADLQKARRARALLRDQPLLLAEEDGMPGQALYLPDQWAALVTQRQEAGIDKALIAKHLNVSVDLITYWETGQIPAPFYAVLQYAAALDVRFTHEPAPAPTRSPDTREVPEPLSPDASGGVRNNSERSGTEANTDAS